MIEKAKRLEPTKTTLRELFLKSGNVCAFPGCHNIMIDEFGNFIGQICHIEAAEEGGERFNPNMSNEERRSYDNLMLMCYEHHVFTNDVSEYSVTRLKQMKKDHEDKFSGVIQKMQNQVVDYGESKAFKESICCNKLSLVLKWKATVEENHENSKVLNTLLHKMLNLPIETRTLLAIMVARSFEDRVGNCNVPLHEIEAAIGKDSHYILMHIDIMKRRMIISEPDIDEYGCPFGILYSDSSGWNYWSDIREFCKKTTIPIAEIIVYLDFSIFD